MCCNTATHSKEFLLGKMSWALLLFFFMYPWRFPSESLNSLHVSGEESFRKLDLDFLYLAWGGFLTMFIWEGHRLLKKELNANWSVGLATASCYCSSIASKKKQDLHRSPHFHQLGMDSPRDQMALLEKSIEQHHVSLSMSHFSPWEICSLSQRQKPAFLCISWCEVDPCI